MFTKTPFLQWNMKFRNAWGQKRAYLHWKNVVGFKQYTYHAHHAAGGLSQDIQVGVLRHSTYSHTAQIEPLCQNLPTLCAAGGCSKGRSSTEAGCSV